MMKEIGWHVTEQLYCLLCEFYLCLDRRVLYITEEIALQVNMYILPLLQGEKTIQAVPAGAKPAIITATRPITKMIVTQPKGIGSTVQPATKIIPTKIVYGQQGKTQVQQGLLQSYEKHLDFYKKRNKPSWCWQSFALQSLWCGVKLIWL